MFGGFDEFWGVLTKLYLVFKKRLLDPIFYGQPTSRMSISHLEPWGLHIWALGSPKEPKNDPTYPQFLPFSLVSWHYQKWLHDPIFYTKPTLFASRWANPPSGTVGGQSVTIGDPQQTPKNIQYSLNSDCSLVCLLQLNLYEPLLIIPFLQIPNLFCFQEKHIFQLEP